MDFDRKPILAGSAGVGAIALAGLVANPSASSAAASPAGGKPPIAPDKVHPRE